VLRLGLGLGLGLGSGFGVRIGMEVSGSMAWEKKSEDGSALGWEGG
jgi:hypothetical protein